MQTFTQIVMPGALLQIFTGLKVALALSWAVVVAAELVGAQSGLGFMISDAALLFRIPGRLHRCCADWRHRVAAQLNAELRRNTARALEGPLNAPHTIRSDVDPSPAGIADEHQTHRRIDVLCRLARLNGFGERCRARCAARFSEPVPMGAIQGAIDPTYLKQFVERTGKVVRTRSLFFHPEGRP